MWDEWQAAELTVRGLWVVLPKGLVLGNVWVEEAQRVLRNVFRCHHLIGADDVWQGDGRQLLLGVRFHRVVRWLVWWRLKGITMVVKMFTICSLFRKQNVSLDDFFSQEIFHSMHLVACVSIIVRTVYISIIFSSARKRPGRPGCSPCTSYSTQVKVMAPSRLLSLKRRRKVPGHLLLSRFFSRSLLMKPMMELRKMGTKWRKWDRHSQHHRRPVTTAEKPVDLPIVPQGGQVSLDQVQDSFDPQPEREGLLVGALMQAGGGGAEGLSDIHNFLFLCGNLSVPSFQSGTPHCQALAAHLRISIKPWSGLSGRQAGLF